MAALFSVSELLLNQVELVLDKVSPVEQAALLAMFVVLEQCNKPELNPMEAAELASAHRFMEHLIAKYN